MKKLLLLCVLALTTAHAQENLLPGNASSNKLGVYAGYQYNLHSAGFSELPGVPNCCPSFKSGTGAGFALGALYEIPLSRMMSVALRAGYSSIGATLKETQSIGNAWNAQHQVVSAMVDYYLETSLGIISIEPALTYSPFTFPLTFNVGIQTGYLVVKSYSQKEVLVSPENAVFQGDSLHPQDVAVRNQHSGTIEQTNNLQFAGFAGISTEIPIGKNITLSPELDYFYSFTNIVKDSTWNTHTFRLATAFKYHLPISAPPPVEEPVKEKPVVTPPPPHAPTLSAALSVSTVRPDGKKAPVTSLTIEETEIEENFPLLLYVFFNEGSSDLSQSSLHFLSASTASTFKEATLPQQTLEIYHNMLNILGARLRQYPKATITITGCNDDMGTEKGNQQLSKARAEAVKQYLTDIWSIASDRISIRARNLPAKPTNNSTTDGQAENRRVEISSSTLEITEPVHIKEISRNATPATIEIAPAITAEAGVKKWSVEVFNNAFTYAAFNESGAPHPVTWTVDPAKFTEATSSVTVQLTTSDQRDQEKTATATVPAQLLTLNKKRSEIKNDKRYEKFSLVLFGYNEDELDDNHRRILDKVKERITPRSTVTITGYTDRIGDPTYNKQLAERRCSRVKDYISGTISADRVQITPAFGENFLFNNDLPEGRSYSRTVQIVIETPVKE